MGNFKVFFGPFFQLQAFRPVLGISGGCNFVGKLNSGPFSHGGSLRRGGKRVGGYNVCVSNFFVVFFYPPNKITSKYFYPPIFLQPKNFDPQNCLTPNGKKAQKRP